MDDIHKRLVKEGATLDMARKSVKVVFAHNLCTGKQLGVPPEGFNIPVVEQGDHK